MTICNIKKLIDLKNWNSIIKDNSPKDICCVLNFDQIMHLIEKMFYENMQDDQIQQFALNLAFETRNYFRNQWEIDWKNDVFLGHLCCVLWRYKDQYICYKKAYDKLTDPPESILLLLAGCDNIPSILNHQKIEKYLKSALEKKITYEGALMMKALYHHKTDLQMETYWDNMCTELLNKNIHTETIIPDVLMKSGEQFHT